MSDQASLSDHEHKAFVGGFPDATLSPVQALSSPFVVEQSDTENQAHAHTSSDTRIDNNRFGFVVGQLNFLIKTDTLCQVRELPAIYALPNLRPWVPGVANIRGNFVPILDIQRYLDHENFGRQKKKLLILGRGADSVGLLVSGYPSREMVSEAQKLSQLPPLPEKLQGLIVAAYQLDKTVFLEIDRDKLLLDLTKSAIQ